MQINTEVPDWISQGPPLDSYESYDSDSKAIAPKPAAAPPPIPSVVAPPPAASDPTIIEVDDDTEVDALAVDSSPFFEILGYDRDDYFIHHRRKKQVMKIKLGSLNTSAGRLALCPGEAGHGGQIRFFIHGLVS